MRILAVIIAMVLFLSPVYDVSESSAAWQNNYFLMNKCYNESRKQQADYWKKFDAEMHRVKHDFDTDRHDSNPGGTLPSHK